MPAIVHSELGSLAPTISTLEPFRPERWMTCPGNLKKFRRVATRKFLRDQGESLYSLPRRIRAAAIEQAVDSALCRFLDAPYQKLKITDDEPARAVLSAIAYARRSGWRLSNDGASRRDSRRGAPYIGSMAARGDNPAAVAATIETAGRYRRYGTEIQGEVAANRARAAIVGGDVETRTGETVHCPGGKSYGEGARMVATTTKGIYVPGEGVQDWNGEQIPFKYRRVTYRAGWTMEPTRRGNPIEWPAGEVPQSIDTPAEPGRFIPPPPAEPVPMIPGAELTRRPISVRALEIAAAGHSGRGVARVILAGMDAEPIR